MKKHERVVGLRRWWTSDHVLHISLVSLFFLGLAVVFFLYPEIDICLSEFFFDANDGFRGEAYHLLHGNYLFLIWAYIASFVAPAVFGIYVLVLFCRIYSSKRSFFYKHYKDLIYVLSAVLFGCVLLVKLLKDFFRRARPESIIEFNGDKMFSPAFVVSDQCQGDCSFVSMHAAAIFMFFSLALLIKNRVKRRIAVFCICMMGLFVGFGRLYFGKHFFSDVLFSGFFVYIAIYLIAIVFGILNINKKDDC